MVTPSVALNCGITTVTVGGPFVRSRCRSISTSFAGYIGDAHSMSIVRALVGFISCALTAASSYTSPEANTFSAVIENVHTVIHLLVANAQVVAVLAPKSNIHTEVTYLRKYTCIVLLRRHRTRVPLL